MLDLNVSGSQWWNLTTGNNDSPTLTQGKATNFFCNTVPDRCPTARLAYYLPYLVLTIYGTLIQPATSGSPVYYDQLRGCLIDSIDWISSWFGTVVSANHVKGAYLPVVEFVSGGWRYAARQRPPIPAAAGTYPFVLNVAIPAASNRMGKLGGFTSNLALLFQTSQLKLNVASASVLGSISTSATFGALTARISAKLVPSNQLVLGTPVENIVHQVVASTNSAAVQIKGFGTDTQMQGIQAKGGVVFLGELTNVNQQGGVFAAENVQQYSFPWRGQPNNYHPETQMQDLLNALPNSRPQVLPSNIAPASQQSGGDSEGNSFPYAMNTSDQQATTGSAAPDLKGSQVWPLVPGADQLDLTDVQTADSDQQYFLTVNGGFSAGSHLIYGSYARAWLPNMVNAWVGEITKGQDSLAAYVLGDKLGKASLGQRFPSKHVITEDQRTYLPWQLK